MVTIEHALAVGTKVGGVHVVKLESCTKDTLRT
jgi:hypothetical protein